MRYFFKILAIQYYYREVGGAILRSGNASGVALIDK